MALVLPVRLDREEALRYLGRGSKHTTVPLAVITLLDQAESWASRHIKPRGTFRTMRVCRDSGTPEVTRLRPAEPRPGGHLELHSGQLRTLLAGCDYATLLAITLGAELDERIAVLSQQGSLAEAAVLDAVCSAAAECAADDLTARIRAEAASCGYAVTRRFSPGYGDLALAVQPDLLAWVGGGEIGLQTNRSFMLMPQKSVTALVGWQQAGSGPDEAANGQRCRDCDAADCPFRVLGRCGR